ncbi:glycoside hydrolase family protein [Phenylobacterium sp.]|uniref:glycoside hydrolase family protein n=1 Tax=Phenylobacterium sp. TaxID=1871053 RepID=UPI002897AA0D|nr:glycoside hydrolase family protein [Phenylobacterium sp.]
MKPRYQVSRSAIELIKRFEGYRRKSAQLADGRWTIGHGHTLTAREGAEVSEQDAEALLLYDLIGISHSINEWVFTPLNQNQFDALAAFAFNIGLENFRRSSVLRRLNEGSLIQAACAMELWRKAEFEGEKIVVDALVRRRSAEKTLFLTPVGGWIPAPSPVLQPNIDLDATGVVPRQTPTALNAPMEGPQARVERDEVHQERPTPVQDDDAQSPAAAAAASVSSRLSSIFSEPIRQSPVVEPGPRLVVEEPGPVMAAFPQPAAEPAFVLTPPTEEEFAQPETFEPPKLELVAANESEPNLFEEPAVDTAPEVVAELEPAPVEAAPEAPLELAEPKRPALLPAFGLAGAGAALFGGCLFWAINMPPPQGEGGMNPGTIVWLAGIAGVGLIGVAVYMILDRLGRPDIEHVEATLERDE